MAHTSGRGAQAWHREGGQRGEKTSPASMVGAPVSSELGGRGRGSLASSEDMNPV